MALEPNGGLVYGWGDSFVAFGEFSVGVSAMVELSGRDIHLIKKALAIAVLVIERTPSPFQSFSDQADMKEMLDRLFENDTELATYTRAARIAVTGEPE